MPSVRRTAEVFSEKEGSLESVHHVAVAEKLAHLEHEEWARKRKQPTKALAARALNLLDKAATSQWNRETNCRRATGLSDDNRSMLTNR